MATGMNSHLHVLILAGGSGRRLWPWSRPGSRKPELPLVHDRTPLEEAIETALTLVPPDRLHLVAAEGVISQPGPCQLIIEPRGRNTLSAVTVGALKLFERDPQSQVIVLPADHHIADRDALRNGLYQTVAALNACESGFWIHGTESAPSGSYGCVLVDDSSGTVEFIEKPTPEQCEQITESVAGAASEMKSFRHCGIFAFGTRFYRDTLSELGPLDPDLLPEISIDDYLISHPDFSSSLKFQPLSHRWSDLGDWRTIRQVRFPHRISRANVQIRGQEVDSISHYPPGEPLVLDGVAPLTEGDLTKRIVCLGMPDLKITHEGSTWRIVGNADAVDSIQTLVFHTTDEVLEIEGLAGGLVACMSDLLVVCSEESLGSGLLQKASRVLDAELLGDKS